MYLNVSLVYEYYPYYNGPYQDGSSKFPAGQSYRSIQLPDRAVVEIEIYSIAGYINVLSTECACGGDYPNNLSISYPKYSKSLSSSSGNVKIF